MLQTLILIAALLLLGSCSGEEEKPEAPPTVLKAPGCRRCHPVKPDRHHQFDCPTCHGGDENEHDAEQAHRDLVARPAHPEHAPTRCGGCHDRELAMVKDNSHYLLDAHIGLVRQAFGGQADLTVAGLPEPPAEPSTELELVDDLLRRRCLRCHVYSGGDNFASVSHATGCGACHLAYDAGHPVSHDFEARPRDERCLSCHYGNHVGADYHGRYEHDFNEEYRTPFTTRAEFFRPYGVEYHQLEADLHQRAGMLCVDCHNREQVMGSRSYVAPGCASCHAPEGGDTTLPAGMTAVDGGFVFTSAATGLALAVPLMRHPAHETYRDRVDCQVCHANWSFNDTETHLLRIDHDDFDSRYRLSLDGSSEVSHIIGSHADFDGEWLEPFMTDKLSGAVKPGLWLKGYTERRWDRLLLTRDGSGTLVPARPMLDLSLSWIDSEENVRFDNIRPQTRMLLPYTPHTTGAAGLLYEQRILRFLAREKYDLPAPGAQRY